MDTTITMEEVATLLGSTLPSTNPRPNFENIHALRRYIERTLMTLPCPQSIHLGWKGLVISREMYALLTTTPFCRPNNPGPMAIYIRNDPTDLTPLTHTEQAIIDTVFARECNYYQSLVNIERACYIALDASIDDAFKVSNIPTIVGWHAGMETRTILDQLSSTYGQPTPAALKINDTTFRGQYSTADAPEVLFRCIENCAEIAILGNNPYTKKQLITNAIRLLLSTGLYIRAFEEWDHLLPATQTWIELRCIIQEAFQLHLNATAPTAGGQGYVPAYHQNAFGALKSADSDDGDVSLATTVATQVAALTYQSQLTQSTAASTTQCQEMQLAQLAAAQDAQHATLHQIIEGLNAVTFNVSDAGRGSGGRGQGNCGRPGPGHSIRCGYAQQIGASSYNGGYTPPVWHVALLTVRLLFMSPCDSMGMLPPEVFLQTANPHQGAADSMPEAVTQAVLDTKTVMPQ
jgi:hypothetical protein